MCQRQVGLQVSPALSSAGSGEGEPDAEGRVRRPADRFLFPGGEAEEDHGGQPRAGFTVDG